MDPEMIKRVWQRVRQGLPEQCPEEKPKPKPQPKSCATHGGYSLEQMLLVALCLKHMKK